MKKRWAGRDGFQLLPVGGQFGGPGEYVLLGQPFLVAALAPVGEVLLTVPRCIQKNETAGELIAARVLLTVPRCIQKNF
jgi:hypothetical protein